MTSSSTPTPSALTLGAAFDMVTCTPGDAIAILNSLAEANTDKNPGLVASINAAISQLASTPTTAAEIAAETPTY